MRLPVAAKIALHSAGGTGGTPGSPTPPPHARHLVRVEIVLLRTAVLEADLAE